MDLGQKILYQRKAHHLTQEQLAEKLHVTRQTLSKWEGNLSSPSLESIAEMSKLFALPTDYFLKEETPVKGEDPVSSPEAPSTPKSSLSHVFGILGIVLGALGSVLGLVFSIIGKKKATDEKDRKLNSIALGVSIAGLAVALALTSLGTYFFIKKLPQPSDPQSSLSSSSEPATYPVVFYDYDATSVLYEGKAERGKKATYIGKNPTRAKDESGSYVFSGWNPSIDTLIWQKTSFIATYKETIATYKVTFTNYDGSTLQEDTITYGEYDWYKGEDPKKTSDVSGNFRFDGFLPNPGQTPITKDTTFVAQFSHVLYSYLVEFRNKAEDGGKLWGSGYTNYGEVPSFYYNEPFKEKTIQHIYTFKNWDKDPLTTKIYSATTFYANYTEGVRSYQARFYNDDRAHILEEVSVPYGGYASYSAATPSKTADGSVYVFAHWDKDPATSAITADTNFFAVYTSSPNEGAFSYKELADGTYSIESASEGFSFNDVSMPSTYLGKDVTEIPNFAFEKCSFKNVVLPSKLRSIGTYAFSEATLPSLTLPDGVTSLGDDAFSSITTLREFKANEGLLSIGKSCFSGDWDLRDFAFPGSLTSIGEDAFYKTGLTSASLSSTALTHLGDSAFQDTKLTAISFPSTLSLVPSLCCNGCSLLTDVLLPSSITGIGSWAFKNCVSLASITLPSALLSVGSKAFENTSLTSLRFPSHVNVWGSGVVEGAKLLSKVFFEEGITTLEYKVLASDLSELSALKTVYVPSTLLAPVEDTFYFSSEGTVAICLKQEKVPSGFTRGWVKNGTIALYRENQPSESGHFFHLDNAGEVQLWS